MVQHRCPDTRWSWVEIDKGALRRNTRAFKEKLEPGVRMMAVVKADAYGHGAVECVKVMHAAGADQFAVATVEEGLELRHAGVTWPILILSEPPMECVQTLIENDIMPSVYTPEFALAYGECAAAFDKVGKYHLAIETGMTRIGVGWKDALEFRRSIDFHRGLSCAGTFTHFATAEVPNDWTFGLQYRRFTEAVAEMRAAGVDCGLVHCDNTPATVLHPETHLDMCRVGVGLYGMQPAESTRPHISLDPVMSVRARVTRVVYPPVGSGVGYGQTYSVARQNVQIATFPIGYADGLARSLSGKMDVLVHGTRCPQVGNICMDQSMFAVDVNTTRAARPMDEVHYGDLVTVMGADGDERITAEEIAGLRGTINYEVTCNFGARLEKVYI
ncbi:alanine racemase [uncultured Parolsenella sp.]|uniref:alanine racemase n=1 Tax=uncultured Parolsenella sp. TaxID=2083008 RepID=UPI0025D04878|nr:alanine racemase [uncultured Parolsenella sp.]